MGNEGVAEEEEGVGVLRNVVGCVSGWGVRVGLLVVGS